MDRELLIKTIDIGSFIRAFQLKKAHAHPLEISNNFYT